MAAKRVRTSEASDRRFIEIRVKIPGKLVPDVVIASSGKSIKPKLAIHPVRFNTTTPHKFWKLWLKFSDYVLCKEGESEPFMDFEAPITVLGSCTFVATAWKPEYERQRQHLTKLGYADNLRQLEENIAAEEATLEEMRKRRDVLRSRIDAIGETLRANAQ